ncbi:hypothetical protein ASG73_09680 [Janibacter sp. Soil728]|uniref:MauE/DoxX family redox-associated membrane protein n=1 Tax=Janibacter sp. Soil728 TaxID=1736393 RepID=UPI0006FE902B|nr:MauE/DoxX family redox-associated membrane protein [Janibacter sp. Soil728]KRE37876.1 hypothetical protein ASG73_09680 [Janibacter sp. Soil728]
MHASPLILPPLLIAALLLISGAAKVRHPEETRSAFSQLRLPGLLTKTPAPSVLPWAEIGLALALLAVPAPFAVVVAVVALALFVAYLVVIVRALGFGYPVTCSCFGRLGLGEVTRRTAVRNILLVVLALLTVWSATAQDSVVMRLAAAPATAWLWLALVVLTVAVVVVTFGGTKGGSLTSSAAADRTDGTDADGGPDGDLDELDYSRQPLPFAALEDESGRSLPLRSLVSDGAMMLVFVSPGCGPCATPIERIPAWDELLGPVRVRAVVSLPLEAALGAVPHLAERILHDPQGTLAQIFGVGTPGAVLLGGDGLLAGGPVQGSAEVLAFVDDVHAELVEAGVVEAGPVDTVPADSANLSPGR